MFIIIIIVIIFIWVLANNINNELIISLSSNQKSIINTEKVLFSILNQNVDDSSYKILLFLSKNDFNDKNQIPKNLIILEKAKKIRIIIILSKKKG